MTLDKILNVAYTILFPVLGWFIVYLIVRTIERFYGLTGDLLKKSISNYDDALRYLKRLASGSQSGALPRRKRYMLFGKLSKECRQAEHKIKLYLFDNPGNKVLSDAAVILMDIDSQLSSVQRNFVSKKDEDIPESLQRLSVCISSMKEAVVSAM